MRDRVPRLGRNKHELGSPLWRASVNDEVDAELAFHVEMRTRELIERGMDPAAARAAAVARFGDFQAVNDECRDIGNSREREMRRTEYVGELLHDARFAIRQLARTPLFTAIAIATLALGVGATTAIFSAVEAVVLRPFPFPRPGELTFLFTSWHGTDGDVSVGDFADWRKRSSSFADLAAIQFVGTTLSTGDSPERVVGAQVTATLFSTYGVAPELGRVFTAAEDQPGQPAVVVLSDGLWRRAYGADSAIVGRTITVNGGPASVIGVMPPAFDPTDSHEALWMPAAYTPERLAFHDEHYLTVVGRLKPGVGIVAAQQEMTAIARRMSDEYPTTNADNSSHVVPLAGTVIGGYRARLFVLLGAVACVLLIACVNVANLLLARGATRSTEFAIRSAIGAGRARIVRQLLAESLVLALASAAAGVGLAWGGVRMLVAAAPANIPRLATTRIDGWVLLFALGVAIVSSVLFGLVPALKVSRGNLESALREGGRQASSSPRDRVRSALVAGEVAIALTLLVAAGLLIRSAIYLDRLAPGFDPTGILSVRVAMRPAGYKQGADEAEQTFTRILDAVRAAPGVQSAAVTSQAPMGPGGGSNGIVPEGKTPDIRNAVDARLRMVSPGYLSTMRVPLVAGRDIDRTDVRGGPRVAVVSAALAKLLWPGQNAVGKRFACCEGSRDDPRWKTVVGVSADVRSGGPTRDVQPEFYLPMSQSPAEAWSWVNREMTIVARSANGNGASVTPGIRAAIKTIDASLPVFSVSTMDQSIARSLAEQRFHLMLLVTLGAVALLLAGAGIYSVISFVVALRTHEIGVRLALGATGSDVVRLLTRQGLRPVVAGAVLGALLASWATRLLRGSVYGVQTSDPTTLVAGVAVLLGVAWLAILAPARRATRVDPTTALHG
jgi:putative ABC transport system permease protein